MSETAPTADLCRHCDPTDEPLADKPGTCAECGIKQMPAIEVEMPPTADVSLDHDQPVEARISDLRDIFERAENGEYDGKVMVNDLLPDWCEDESHDHMTGYYHTDVDAANGRWCPVCGVPYEHVHCGTEGCEHITQIS